MAGLLSDVLPFLYSQGDRLKRQLGGLLSDPVGSVEQTLGGLLDAAAVQRALSDKAFANKQRPFQVTDKQAMGQMADNMLAGPLSFAPAGITVWHGSPHKFDKFDSSKIGTGEGAQAYGHGLYLAESPDVASQYQRNLTASTVKLDSKPLAAMNGLERQAADYATEYGGVNKALEVLNNKIAYGSRFDDIDWLKQVRDKLSASKYEKSEGALYKVDLPDEHVAKMLDWDKPLSQQPHVMDLINKQESARTQSVLDRRLQTLANVGEDAPNAATLKRQIELLREEVANPQSGVGSMTGGEYYNYLRRRDMPPTEQADMFRGAGIPGIRYLDGGSRGAGQGTSNFVVFPGNEDILKILERNGVPLETVAPKFTYPQEQALETARQNAVKMLGLPENNTAMDRARALGFDTELLHGTTNDFRKFAESTRHSTYATQDPAIADIYANATGRHKALREINAGPNVIPLVGRGKLLETSDYRNGSGGWMQNNMADALGVEAKRGLTKELPAHGYDGAKVTMDDLGGSQTQYIYPDPKVLRSRFAAFDPARVNENDLLGKADPALLAALGIGTGAALTDEDVRKYLQSLTTP